MSSSRSKRSRGTRAPTALRLLDRIRLGARDAGVFALAVAVVAVSSWVVVGDWMHAWRVSRPGLGATAADLVALFPGSDAAVLPGFVVGTLLGIAVVLPFDSYKRVQGMAVFGGVLVALATLAISGVPLAPTVGSLLAAVVGVALGVALSGVLGQSRTMGARTLDGGFGRVRTLTFGVAAVGVLDANVAYRVPVAVRDGGVAAVSPSFAGASSWTGLIVGAGALCALVGVLEVFRRYDLEKTVFLLGPSRAGKTYLIGAMAYAIKEEAIGSAAANPVELEPPLGGAPDSLYAKFRREEFDDIGATSPDEAHVYEMTFPHGSLMRKRMTIRVMDYAGELLTRVETDPDEIDLSDLDREQRRGLYGAHDPRLVDRLTEHVNETTPDDRTIVTALSVMLLHADSIALVLPGDDFVGHLDYPGEFPDWISADDLDKDREPPDSGTYLSKYDAICRQYLDERNLFFLVTMADMFLGPDGDLNPDYYTFQREVREALVRSPADLAFGDQFAMNFDTVDRRTGLRQRLRALRRAGSRNLFVPIYLVPNNDGHIDSFEPSLRDSKFATYPVWGLERLLWRLRG